MSVDVAVGTPLAAAMADVILPKLMELGWSTGLQDDTLSEYIILMLANGKTQEQIASELSNDLLDLGPDDQGAVDFARWLFEQVGIQSARLSGSASSEAVGTDAQVTGDADMQEAADGSPSTIPTGPRNMRNGKTRDKRMLGQLNKSLERSSDAALHKIRGAGGVGRINSHSREPPKGPRQQQIQRGLAAANGRPMQGLPAMPPMPPMGMQNGGQYQQQQAPSLLMPQEQIQHMMAMMQEQANMMAQITSQGMNFQGSPGRFQHQNQNGRSLSDRVERRGRQHGRQQNHAQDVSMGDDESKPTGEAGEAGEGEPAQKSIEETMCKFNQNCTKEDCQYAHSGPSAPPKGPVDTTVVCEFGVRCKNTRCAGRHPSPAKKYSEMAKADCKFGMTCQNPNCLFKHPNAPPCKRGADCDEVGCTFWHNPVTCKYPECTFPTCPYKHAAGQKKVRGPVRNKVWQPNGGAEHVSERKFVNGEKEETIIPGQTNGESEMHVDDSEAPQ